MRSKVIPIYNGGAADGQTIGRPMTNSSPMAMVARSLPSIMG